MSNDRRWKPAVPIISVCRISVTLTLSALSLLNKQIMKEGEIEDNKLVKCRDYEEVMKENRGKSDGKKSIQGIVGGKKNKVREKRMERGN